MDRSPEEGIERFLREREPSVAAYERDREDVAPDSSTNGVRTAIIENPEQPSLDAIWLTSSPGVGVSAVPSHDDDS